MRTEAEILAVVERLRTLKPPYDPAVVVAAAEALDWVLGATDDLPGELEEV